MKGTLIPRQDGIVEKIKATWQHLPVFDQDQIMILLGAVGGCVDAITYLGLGHVFTANMTGNTVFLGLAIGQGQSVETLRAATALLGYCLGTLVGALIIRRNRVTIGSIAFTAVICVEWLLLVTLLLTWWTIGNGATTLTILIILSGLSMGLQSTAVLNLHITETATTYLGGTITSFFANLVERPSADSNSTDSHIAPRRHKLKLKAAIWISFTLAAGVSAFAEMRWQMWSLLLPLVIIGLVILNTMSYRHN